MTILLIDDSRFVQIAIEKALAEKGHLTSAFSDGEEGVRAAVQKAPDLILLDIMLPGTPGTGILRRLKSDPALSSIPIIVLTSLGRMDETRLLDEGADGCLLKMIEKVLKRHQQRLDQTRAFDGQDANKCAFSVAHSN